MSVPTSPRIRDRWRTWRGVLGTLLLISAFAVLMVGVSTPRPGGYLDAEATGSGGARALAEILADQGVRVVQVRTLEEARSVATPDSLVVLARPEYLMDDDLLDRIDELPGDRLLIEPFDTVLDELAPGVTEGSYEEVRSREPGCGMREAVQAGNARMGGSYYQVTGPDARCYDGTLIRFRPNGRTTTIVGSGQFLTNGRLIEDGNAALAVNLVGTRSQVTWFAPRIPLGNEPPATLEELLPEQLTWLVWSLIVAVGLIAIAQGRRLGPVVTEKLPVIVRAAETVEGRGRLYRARRARDRAGHALRAATLDRIVPRLGLAPGSAADAIVSAIAVRIGQDAGQIRSVLYGPAPADDAQLVALARQLDVIERQVRDS
ncbi:putative membrane protein [Acrocarpospora pleiomorpha]|uniref:Putative membrane protein n=1 Tax=Acrocarpospora pleiomorpha TaxID=90975 RepID=A0A5M3XPW5_9ACTN|nr:DUF4350 domain-containing protein [Acrocarpospora pleiomorpha]GES23387.1 putative membrane protein [Acrocarpospora pleiomorpha]